MGYSFYEESTTQRTTTWLGVSLGLWIPVLLTGKPFSLLPFYSAVVAISMLAHELSQKLVAKRFGLETTFRVWESGLLFSILFGTVGSFFPTYGSTYVRKLDWRYEHKKKENGVLCAIGPVASLILAYSFGFGFSSFFLGGGGGCGGAGCSIESITV